MEEQTIQTKINMAFIDAISSSTAFTPDEITKIESILASGHKPNKMAEQLLNAIGGSDDENT